MNCVIIGTGWLGSPLMETLTLAGYTVSGSKRTLASSTEDENQLFVYPSSSEATKSILKNADVIVLAFPPNRSSIDRYATDCLEVCQHIQSSCKIILTSSTSVYPATIELCLEDELDLSQFPDHSIALAEHSLRKAFGERLTVIRFAGLIGPNRHPARNMSKSGKIYAGNGAINVIHQLDAVRLIVFVIQHAIWGETLNGCSPEHPLRGEYYTWMAHELGLTPPLFEELENESKVVNSDKSISMGFAYLYPNPFDYPL